MRLVEQVEWMFSGQPAQEAVSLYSPLLISSKKLKAPLQDSAYFSTPAGAQSLTLHDLPKAPAASCRTRRPWRRETLLTHEIDMSKTAMLRLGRV